MDCLKCQRNEEHMVYECAAVIQEHVLVPTWDRTKWDRTQAVSLIAGVTLPSAAPLWLLLLVIA